MKLIHWEYNEHLLGELTDESKVSISIGQVRSIENNEVNGFYLRWHARLLSTKGLVIDCIAEISYPEVKIDQLSIDLFSDRVQNSFEEFRAYFSVLLEQEDLVADLNFSMDKEETANALIELNRK